MRNRHSYSTSPGKVAADGSGKNSPYTEALVKYMVTPGLQIEDVFKKVRQDIGNKTQGQQIPWELSSLEGQFYFKTRNGRANNDSDTSLSDSEAILRQKILVAVQFGTKGQDKKKIDVTRVTVNEGLTIGSMDAAKKVTVYSDPD